MRRDYFTLTVDGIEDRAAQRPVVTVSYEGPIEQLESRLQKGTTFLDSEEIDVSYRLKEPQETADSGGVLAIADRVTGEYILELNADADDVFAVIDAAREFGQAGDTEDRYRIVIETDGDDLVTYDKSALLVYDAEGDLLRSQSLIPSGVEL
jgi:hypothetical protein